MEALKRYWVWYYNQLNGTDLKPEDVEITYTKHDMPVFNLK